MVLVTSNTDLAQSGQLSGHLFGAPRSTTTLTVGMEAISDGYSPVEAEGMQPDPAQLDAGDMLATPQQAAAAEAGDVPLVDLQEVADRWALSQAAHVLKERNAA